jgi:hypothetical protein
MSRRSRGGIEAQLYSFFKRGTIWGWVVSVTLRLFYPRERPGTHCTGGWVGPKTGLEGCGKSRPSPGFEIRTVQPVASRYTSYAIAVHFEDFDLVPMICGGKECISQSFCFPLQVSFHLYSVIVYSPSYNRCHTNPSNWVCRYVADFK